VRSEHFRLITYRISPKQLTELLFQIH
jgi:hypothetical protein